MSQFDSQIICQSLGNLQFTSDYRDPDFIKSAVEGVFPGIPASWHEKALVGGISGDVVVVAYLAVFPGLSSLHTTRSTTAGLPASAMTTTLQPLNVWRETGNKAFKLYMACKTQARSLGSGAGDAATLPMLPTSRPLAPPGAALGLRHRGFTQRLFSRTTRVRSSSRWCGAPLLAISLVSGAVANLGLGDVAIHRVWRRAHAIQDINVPDFQSAPRCPCHCHAPLITTAKLRSSPLPNSPVQEGILKLKSFDY
jgi:hypothetical protein